MRQEQPPQAVEPISGERVKEVADDLNKVGAQLQELDSSNLTPEQLKALGIKVLWVLAITAAMSTTTEVGFGALREYGEMDSFDISYIMPQLLASALVVWAGSEVAAALKEFVDGVKKYCEKVKSKETNGPKSNQIS